MIDSASCQVSECKKKILEYKWEKIKKKIMEDCLWQVTKDELEALEACFWLKATGFQEYVNLYEDNKFPIDLSVVQKEHNILDEDSIQSLVRRLEILNKCAKITEKRVRSSPFPKVKLKGVASASPGHQQNLLQCSASSMSHIRSNTMSDSSSEVQNRKRPSSKYGIYNVNCTKSCSDTDAGNSCLSNEETRLSRTFSFSGTCDSSGLGSINTHGISASSNDVFENNHRLSFYDNVPLTVVNASEKDYRKIELSQSDSIFEEPLSGKQRHFASNLESDDDLSVSSPEDEDDIETLEGQKSTLNEASNKEMGSVDSGVPSSPILRSPSVRRRRVRWHSFQKSSDRESVCLTLKIQNLSAGQINVLRKISLLRLTALMERYSIQNRSGWHWTIPKLLRRLKSPDNREKNVFGASLLTTVQRTGLSLPRSILLSMNFLIRTALSNVGIFRRSGMKSRIEKLKAEIESTDSKLDFNSYSPYDVADMLKQYLRELPEPLLTSKLAETFIAIYKDVPKELREQAMQLAIILMPDENREALQTILDFLNQFAAKSYENQMDHQNLSVCFAPAFFHIFGIKNEKTQNAKRLKRTFSSAKSEKDLEDTNAAQQCLVDLMKSVHLFTVPEDVMMKCRFSYIEQGDPVSLEQLSQNVSDSGVIDGYNAYLDNCFAGLLQESHPKAKGWMQQSVTNEVEISYKIVKDGYPIRLWKAVLEINASPGDVLRRFVKERHLWDDEMVHWEYIEKLANEADVFYCEAQTIAPSLKRDYLLLRSWRNNLNGSCCGCVSTSINHPLARIAGGIRATVLADRCLMEPCGLGRSRITYISRTDLRGKSPRYYNKAVGPWIVYSCVSKIRDTFNYGPDGPETNV